MKDPVTKTVDKYAERRKLSSEARNVAIDRLKAAHKAEYDEYYREEATKRGIKPRSLSREDKIARLRAELTQLEVFITNGRKVAKDVKSARVKDSATTSDAAQIRAWAVEQAIPVPTRGRIPASIRTAYYAGHPKP